MSAGVIRRHAAHLLFAVALVVATISAMALATYGNRATAANPSTPVYVANGFSNTITSFAEPTPGPAPSATIGDPTLFGQQNGEAFDSSGDLWVASDDLLGEFGTIVEYTPGQLSSSGGSAPHVVLTRFADPVGIAFDSAGDLWVTDSYDNDVFMIPPGELGASGSPSPTVTLSLQNAPGGLTFDAGGDLWVAEQGQTSSGNQIVEYSRSQLASSGSPSPTVTLSGSSLTMPQDVRFDSSGDLWVTNECDGCAILEFSASQLATSGSPVPAVDATFGADDQATDLAFDTSGGLWVALDASSAVEYSPAQLAAGGNPTPTVTIAENGDEPTSLIFGSSGGLWLGNSGLFSATSVVEIAASDLGTSGEPTPAVVLTPPVQILDGPVGVAVNTSGDLWVANIVNGTLDEFTPAQLTASGNPTPVESITGLDDPQDLAFDANGDLWVSNCGGSCAGSGTTGASIAEFTPSQLATGGGITPHVTLTGSAVPGALAFDGSGDLWVTGCGAGCATGDVVEYTPSQLAASGSPSATITISGSDAFDGIAFDGSGDLWIATTHNAIIEYTAGQLAASGSPTPTITISDGSIKSQPDEIFPAALTFDSAGDLWATGYPNTLVEYTPGQLTSSGSPAPAFEAPLEGSGLSGPYGVATAPIAVARTTTTTTTGPSKTSTTSGGGAILTSSGSGRGTGGQGAGAAGASPAALAVTGAGAVAPITLVGALLVMIGIVGRRRVSRRRRTVPTS